MKKATSVIKMQGFIWDFATDGGAVGSLFSGITIPNNCIVTQISSQIILQYTGAGSQLGIGWVGALTMNNFISGDPIGQVNTSQPNIATLQAQRILITFIGAPATAGRVLTMISYFESSGR